jgi:transposase-like protein
MNYLLFANSIQKSIYIINWIKSTNKEIEKRLKTMNSLPNEKVSKNILS